MDTLQFLQTVWPETGLYALATPYRPPGAKKSVYRHRLFTSVAAAAAEAVKLSGLVDVYFAVHSLRERQVWNPLKKNIKDGTLGAFEVRTHSNMAAARAFFFDLDVEANNPRKHASASEAAAALLQFCKTAKLPLPTVVASGVGLHVYWMLTAAMDSVAWRQVAERLRALAAKLSLHVDPARTTDVSSVLRVPGTLHLKDRANPRPVRVERASSPVVTEHFVQAVRDACVTQGVADTVIRRPLHDDDPMPDIGSNVDKVHGDRPPPTMRAVLSACAQMRYMFDQQKHLSEPEWFQALNTVKFVESPAEWAHALSKGHPGYTPDDTADKFSRIQASGTGPTSCAVLAATCGEERCGDCRFSGRVKNPIMAARLVDAAPAPEVSIGTLLVDDDDPAAAGTTLVATLPNPPKPYRRVRGGGVVMDTSDNNDDEITVTIYEHDLHPLRRVVNAAEHIEQQYWRVTLPREGVKDFALDADALYDPRKLLTVLANNGIYPVPNQIPNLRDYMIAYITELQRVVDAEEQVSHLGWSDDKQNFVLPSGILCRDGSIRPVSLNKQSERVAVHIQKAGTLQGQIDALAFYNHEAYIPQQFFIMGGLAATIFHMTGHHGVIGHMQGHPGSSKSSSLYTAASFWGHPKLYPINGTNSGATVRGRNERISTLANLPVCVDEITHLSEKDAQDLAMNITQPGHRIRLDVTGTERAASGGYKSTIMLTTGNSSLHSKLSVENDGGTASSVRVFEILVTPQIVHKKWEADAFLATLEANYGHIGEVFIAYVLRHYDLVNDRVRAAMKMIDEQAHVTPAERFWSALMAVTVVAAGISRKLKLTTWSPEAMLRWALDQQMHAMRDVMRDEYTDPTNMLTNYLSDIYGSTIVVNTAVTMSPGLSAAGRRVYVERPPRSNSLLCQIDVGSKTLWITHKHFKDYVRRNGGNWREIISTLYKDGTIANRTRKILGGGTEHAGSSVDVHIVNGEHVAISNAVQTVISKIDNPPPGNIHTLRKNIGAL